MPDRIQPIDTPDGWPEALVERIRSTAVSEKRLSELLDDASTDVSDAAKVVGDDPVLVAAIVRQANAFKTAHQITTVDGAISQLGLIGTLKAAVGQTGTAVPKAPPVGPLVELGQTSPEALTISRVAGILRELVAEPLDPGIVTAALLQDLGRLVLDRLDHEAGREDADDLTTVLSAVRRSLPGSDRSGLAGDLVDAWELPSVLCEAVRSHRAPDAQHRPETHALHIASVIGHDLHLKGAQAGRRATSSYALLGLDEDEVVGIVVERLTATDSSDASFK